MAGIVSRAVNILLEDGLRELFEEGTSFLYSRIFAIIAAGKFLVYDIRRDAADESTILMTLRKSTVDSDTLSLLLLAEQDPNINTVNIAVTSQDDFEDTHQYIRDYLSSSDLSVNIVTLHSSNFVDKLVKSSHVFLRGQPDLLDYRFLNRNPTRKFIILYHGVVTKASGNFRADNLIKQSKTKKSSIDTQFPGDYLSRISTITHARSVGSDVERFYRAAADGVKPALLKKCGYPKYDRLTSFVNGSQEPLIPKATQDTLLTDENSRKLLYAPTHKGINATTTLFPFSDYNIENLKEYLQEIKATLYLRVHISEEEAGLYDDIVDGEIIQYAGHEFSPSSIEILPYFDLLITDFSSIYTEYLVLDRPIIFIEDTDNPYWKNKGLAYDYDKYFPGPKVNSQSEFQTAISKSLENPSQFEDERKFVRKVLLPDNNIEFLNCIRKI